MRTRVLALIPALLAPSAALANPILSDALTARQVPETMHVQITVLGHSCDEFDVTRDDELLNGDWVPVSSFQKNMGSGVTGNSGCQLCDCNLTAGSYYYDAEVEGSAASYLNMTINVVEGYTTPVQPGIGGQGGMMPWDEPDPVEMQGLDCVAACALVGAGGAGGASTTGSAGSSGGPVSQGGSVSAGGTAGVAGGLPAGGTAGSGLTPTTGGVEERSGGMAGSGAGGTTAAGGISTGGAGPLGGVGNSGGSAGGGPDDAPGGIAGLGPTTSGGADSAGGAVTGGSSPALGGTVTGGNSPALGGSSNAGGSSEAQDSTDDDGCSCATVGGRPGRGSPEWLLLVGLALLTRRRR